MRAQPSIEGRMPEWLPTLVSASMRPWKRLPMMLSWTNSSPTSRVPRAASCAMRAEAHARNAVFYGDKAIDRSPCGTGTSARMAQLAARGELEVGDDFVHESIIGSLFRGRVEAETRVGNHEAIVPSIEGWARITGFNTIFIDDRDPYAHGFQVV